MSPASIKILAAPLLANGGVRAACGAPLSTDGGVRAAFGTPLSTDGGVRAAFGTSLLANGGAFEFIFILIVFFCILFLAYLTAKIFAKRASGRLKGRYIEIVETLAVGADAQLLVVKAGAELFLVSKSQKQLTFLTKLELTPEEAEEGGAVAPPGFIGSFKAVLEGRLSRNESKSGSGNSGGGDIREEDS